jgi:hypothetical protein
VNDADVAVAVALAPAVSVVAEPTAVPELVQDEAEGPHSKKDTVPAGLPPVVFPLTVTTSAFVFPSWMVLAEGWVAVVEFAAVTVKHSVGLPSEDVR